MALEENLLLLEEGTSTVAADLGNQLHRLTGLVPPRTTMRLFFFLLESGLSAVRVFWISRASTHTPNFSFCWNFASVLFFRTHFQHGSPRPMLFLYSRI